MRPGRTSLAIMKTCGRGAAGNDCCLEVSVKELTYLLSAADILQPRLLPDGDEAITNSMRGCLISAGITRGRRQEPRMVRRSMLRIQSLPSLNSSAVTAGPPNQLGY